MIKYLIAVFVMLSWNLEGQNKFVFRANFGIGVFPVSDLGLEEKAIGFYPIKYKNKPVLSIGIDAIFKPSSNFGLGIKTEILNSNVELTRNYFTPISNKPLLDKTKFVLDQTSLGLGPVIIFFKDKWKISFSSILNFNLNIGSKERLRGGYQNNRGGSIYSEVIVNDGVPKLNLLLFSDYAQFPYSGIGFLTMDLLLSRQLTDRITLNGGFIFQPKPKRPFFHYMANGSNFEIDLEDPVIFNSTELYKRIGAIRLGFGFIF